VQEYFDATLSLISECTQLAGPFAQPELVAYHHLDYRTHFERRVRLNDLAVYRSYYRQPNHDHAPAVD
jgi:tRNA (guanine-N7-)-methyltransferase